MTTIEPLPIPALCPSRPEAKIAVAYVAWHAFGRQGATGAVAIAQSWFARESRRANTGSSKDTVRRKAKKPAPRPPGAPARSPGDDIAWMDRKGQDPVTGATRFTLAKEVRERETWIALGRRLFADDGYLHKYLARGVIQWKAPGLGLVGCMVLGIIERHGPLTMSDLNRVIGRFTQTRTTSSAVKRLIHAGLVSEEDGSLRVPVDLDRVIDEYEQSSGLAARVAAHDEALFRQALDHQIRSTRGTRPGTAKRWLRTQTCVYCNQAGGTAEHYPPEHWGGTDKYSLLFPACRRCNSTYGRRVRNTRKMDTPPEVPHRFDGTPWSEHDLLEIMRLMHWAYVDQVVKGQLEEARQDVEKWFPVWVAYRSGLAQGISATTGELLYLAPTAFEAEHYDPEELQGHAGIVQTIQPPTPAPDPEKGRPRPSPAPRAASGRESR